jgi:hypothetical protein
LAGSKTRTPGSSMMKKTMTLLGLLALSAAGQAQESLQAMYARVPPPPASSAAAAAWLESPAVTQLQAQIESQRAGIGTTMAAAAAAQQPAGMPEDFARASRDPKYAAELKEKIARMTPAEQMAFAQRMSAATSAGALRDVKAMAADPPAVGTAVENYLAYQSRNMSMSDLMAASQKVSAIRDRVGKREMEISGAAAKKLKCSDGEGGCPSAAAEAEDKRVLEEAHVQIVAEYDRALPEIARQFAAVRQARSADIATGQKDMAATRFGAAAQSPTNRQQLASYQNALLNEVEQLLQFSIDAAEWAAARSAQD